jgi:hypothetical protein
MNLAGLALDLADRPSLFGLNLLEPRLAESHTTVIIPLDDRVIFVSLLNCAQFPSRRSEVAQTLDAISGIEFLTGGSGARRAVVSWHGHSQALRRGMTVAVGELCADFVSDYW